MKNEVFIRGAEIGSLEAGKSAIIVDENGVMKKTSPVVDYFVGQKGVCIETMHTIYRTR